MSETKWYLRTQNDTFGPESEAKLVEWAKLGRIQPGQEISEDNVIWHRVEDMAFLDMRFSIDIGDGNPRGPFNRAAAEALLASGRLPKTSTIVEVREPFPEESGETEESGGQPLVVEKVVEEPVVDPEVMVVEKEVVKEVRVEVPVEKIVEKIVEVPPPARTELVVAEVVEPAADTPPPMTPGSIFGNVSREKLVALEAAARRELSSANRKHMSFGLFGGKKK